MEKEAQKALERAEAIIERNYAMTGEVKLLPIAMQHLYEAGEQVWKESKEKQKPAFLKELERTIQKKKESTVEFQRKEKYIICSERYQTIIINEQKVRELVKKTKDYINKKCKKKKKTKQKKN